jgi:hypothetical protein
MKPTFNASFERSITFDCDPVEKNIGNRATLQWLAEQIGGMGFCDLMKNGVRAFGVTQTKDKFIFTFIARDGFASERLKRSLKKVDPVLKAGYWEQVSMELSEIKVEA